MNGVFPSDLRNPCSCLHRRSLVSTCFLPQGCAPWDSLPPSITFVTIDFARNAHDQNQQTLYIHMSNFAYHHHHHHCKLTNFKLIFKSVCVSFGLRSSNSSLLNHDMDRLDMSSYSKVSLHFL